MQKGIDFMIQNLILQALLVGAVMVSSNSFSESKSILDVKVKEIVSQDAPKAIVQAHKAKLYLIVNTASECGHTSQYAGLQKLFETYSPKGLMVLGFPSNDFGKQEPGSNAEIKKFCELKFKVTFPMYEKIVVLGPNKHELYKQLVEQSDSKAEVKWNFEKFLVNAEGKVVGRYPSSVTPEDQELKKAIEKNL